MTTLHPPFLISSALAPALKVGDAVISVLDTTITPANRDQARIEIQTPTFTYVDDSLQSGVGGFHSTVEIFETFLSFMEACGESVRYVTYSGEEGENANLFPRHVALWCAENMDDIGMARCDICDENGNPNMSLIEE